MVFLPGGRYPGSCMYHWTLTCVPQLVCIPLVAVCLHQLGNTYTGKYTGNTITGTAPRWQLEPYLNAAHDLPTKAVTLLLIRREIDIFIFMPNKGKSETISANESLKHLHSSNFKDGWNNVCFEFQRPDTSGLQIKYDFIKFCLDHGWAKLPSGCMGLRRSWSWEEMLSGKQKQSRNSRQAARP